MRFKTGVLLIIKRGELLLNIKYSEVILPFYCPLIHVLIFLTLWLLYLFNLQSYCCIFRVNMHFIVNSE